MNIFEIFEAKKKSLKNPADNPCWTGYHPVGTKQKAGRTVPNCVPNEGVEEAANAAQQAAIAIAKKKKPGVAEGSLEDYEGLKIKFSKDSDGVAVKALSGDGNRVLASVELFFNEKGQLEPQDLWTNDRFQGQGIAKAMYDFLKNKGYTIIRSWVQTDAGKGFWDKHKGPGVNVWEQGVAEDAERLSVGDDVIITGNVRFKGATGVIDSFGRDNHFVVVNLYNHGKHSFHSSDVSENEYADSDDEEARMYDRGDFRTHTDDDIIERHLQEMRKAGYDIL